MMKQLTAFLFTCLFSAGLLAQQNVGIGTTTPKASAKLDISSTTQGVTLPSMTTAQRLAIVNPAKGLLVFDMDKAAFFFFDGSTWKAIGAVTSNTIDPVFSSGPAAPPASYNYGNAISMSNGFAAIGCTTKELSGDAGSVYLLKRDGSSGQWVLFQTLVPPAPVTTANFGSSVCLDSNYLIVGAKGTWDNGIQMAGKAYVYQFNGSSWVLETSFLNPAGSQYNARFGYSVGISSSAATGVTAVIGAPYYNSGALIAAGMATIIKRNAVTGVWSTPEIYYGTTANQFLGFAVAIQGNYSIIGIPGYDTTISTIHYDNCGAAFRFLYDGGHWNLNEKIFSFRMDTSANFGYAVVMKDSLAAISGPNTNCLNNASDFIKVMQLADYGDWFNLQDIELHIYLPAEAATCIGTTLAISKRLLVVGNPFMISDPFLYCNGDRGGRALMFKRATGFGFQYDLINVYKNKSHYADVYDQYAIAVGADELDFGITGYGIDFNPQRGIFFGRIE
jgi:hypothetical protein